MDRALIDQKLESLRRCVQRVETKLPGSLQELKGDADGHRHLDDFKVFAKAFLSS